MRLHRDQEVGPTVAFRQSTVARLVVFIPFFHRTFAAGRGRRWAGSPQRGQRMRWWLFDYAGVIGEHQPDADRRALESVAGPVSPDTFWEAYWAIRTPYDTGQLSAGEYWHAVGRRLGSAWQADRIQQLIRLDVNSWLHVRAETSAF